MQLNPFPKVAIAILNWNGKNFLQQFLPSVITTTYSNYEIIVIDNFSEDDSIAFLTSNYPGIRVIRHPANWGYAKGYNEGLKQIKSDYCVILNSDVEVTSGWLHPMVKLLEADSSVAVCQPKILSYDDKKMFEYAGAAGGWIDKYGYPFSKGRVFEVCETDNGQYDRQEPIFWASGAALFIRSSVFEQQNGFDEYFFAHQEEIDLCWRIQLAGKKIYSCPSSVVFHVGGGTLPKTNSKKTFLNFRNNLVMLTKNLPFRRLWIVPFRILLDATAATKGLLTGEGGYFLAILKAHLAFAKWLLFHPKGTTASPDPKGRLYGVLQKNLIWEYFIKRKRTFSEIVQNSAQDI